MLEATYMLSDVVLSIKLGKYYVLNNRYLNGLVVANYCP